MDDALQESIQRAREFLKKVRNAAMATVNEDNSPHNTPFFFMYNPEFTKIIWGSHPDSQHSKNIIRTGQLFIAIYDSFGRDGFYIKANRGHIVEGDELTEVLTIHNSFRANENKKPLEESYYESPNPQRMWSADVEKIWVLVSERDENDLLIQEHRKEITPQDLIG